MYTTDKSANNSVWKLNEIITFGWNKILSGSLKNKTCKLFQTFASLTIASVICRPSFII